MKRIAIFARTYLALRRQGWGHADARDFARQYSDEMTMGDLT